MDSSLARLLLAFALMVSLTACFHAVKGGPDSVLDKPYDSNNATVTALELIPKVDLEKIPTFTEEQQRIRRNTVIAQRMTMINSEYNKYVRKLQQEQTMTNLGTDLTDLALGIAGTLTGSVGAKTNYAAASALLSGSSAALNRRAFFEQTTVALVSAMDAFRTKVRLRVLSSMKKSIVEYPPEEAYFDLNAYEFAGTLLGAISYVQTTAEKDKESTETTINAKVRNIYALSEAQYVTKTCLSQSLAPDNLARLTPDRLKQAASLLVPPMALEDLSRDEMLDRLQDRIRHAMPEELAMMGSAFASAQISTCAGD